MCTKVLEECKKLPKKPPLLIKIAPDLTREDMEDIASVVTKGKVCYDNSCLFSSLVMFLALLRDVVLMAL